MSPNLVCKDGNTHRHVCVKQSVRRYLGFQVILHGAYIRILICGRLLKGGTGPYVLTAPKVKRK